jgi:hypothetical protein
MIYSADEACDVGADTGSPASLEYRPHRQQVPEDRLTVAMAPQ